MRFFRDGPSIPNSLLEQSEAGRVVFFCGAGVSCYSRNSEIQMPNFLDLTRRVVKHFKPSVDSEIVDALNSWNNGSETNLMSLDQIFYQIKNTFCEDEVNKKVARILSCKNIDEHPIRHENIIKISRNRDNIPQIVTTNFDVLFERATSEKNVRVNVPPFLPDMSQKSPITGITYLHGRTSESTRYNKIQKEYLNKFILSSADFGRAYLSEGWATNFVRYLASEYTVVLIGYRAEDPPMHYLLMGMGSDVEFSNAKLYAFDQSENDQKVVQSRWEAKGITPIMYSSYNLLWETIEEWANKSSNPSQWITKMNRLLLANPTILESYERGQVVYFMQSIKGEKTIMEILSSAHPGWINVFDTKIRTVVERREYHRDRKGSTMKLIYNLDEEDNSKNEYSYRDLPNLTDILTSEVNELATVEDKRSIAVKERMLISWLIKNIDNPIVALWGARQKNLSNNFLTSIRKRLVESHNINIKARLMWNFIIEYHSSKVDSESTITWDSFMTIIQQEGWNMNSCRKFSDLVRPVFSYKVKFDKFLFSRRDLTWEDIRSILDVEVKFPKRGGGIVEVPEKFLPDVVTFLQNNILQASSMISAVDAFNDTKTRTPTCYQSRDVCDSIRAQKYSPEIGLFIKLIQLLLDVDSKLVKSIVESWPIADYYFFRKLKLFMLNNDSLFSSGEMEGCIKGLTSDEFWCRNSERELMYLIADRKNDISREGKKNIGDRLLQPPVEPPKPRTYGYRGTVPSKALSVARGLWLENQNFGFSRSMISEISSIRKSLDMWRDSWATDLVNISDRQTRQEVDTNFDILKGVPDENVIKLARSEEKSHRDSGVRRDPFCGLVQKSPRAALSALIADRDAEEELIDYWKKLIRNLPSRIGKSLYLDIIREIAKLSRRSIGMMWIDLSNYILERHKDAFSMDDELAWKIVDICIDVWKGQRVRVLDGRGQLYRGAVRYPMAKVTQFLVSRCINGAKKGIPDDIKLRLDRILEKTNRTQHQCVTVLTYNIEALYQCDPNWTRQRLMPLFEFDQDAAGYAWNGLLYGGISSERLTRALSYQILNLFPQIDEFSWEKEDRSKCVHMIMEVYKLFSKKFNIEYSEDLRRCIRNMTVEDRGVLISFLGDNDHGEGGTWNSNVVSFLDEIWPKDEVLRTQFLVQSWVNLLVKSGGLFSQVYPIVKNFLVPVMDIDIDLTGFTNYNGKEKPIAEMFPKKVMKLADTIIPDRPCSKFKGVGDILEVVRGSEENLIDDPRYVRFFDIVD